MFHLIYNVGTLGTTGPEPWSKKCSLSCFERLGPVSFTALEARRCKCACVRGGGGNTLSSQTQFTRDFTLVLLPLPPEVTCLPSQQPHSEACHPNPTISRTLRSAQSPASYLMYISTLQSLALCACASQSNQSQGTGAPRLSNPQCLACCPIPIILYIIAVQSPAL